VSELEGANVLVTGGAGTVGSTLVDELLQAGINRIDVLDNMVRGWLVNLAGALATGQVELIQGNIRNRNLVHDLTKGKDLVLEMPRTLLRVMDSDLAVEHGPERLVKNVVRRLADTTAARRGLGFEAHVQLEDGLRELVSWWQPVRDGIAAIRKVGSP
jgi:nucleoside-diphosphate-sugar epimerase